MTKEELWEKIQKLPPGDQGWIAGQIIAAPFKEAATKVQQAVDDMDDDIEDQLARKRQERNRK